MCARLLLGLVMAFGTVLVASAAAPPPGGGSCNLCAQGPIPWPPGSDSLTLAHWCRDVEEPLESVEDCTHGPEPGPCSRHEACEPDEGGGGPHNLAFFNARSAAIESFDCSGALVDHVPVAHRSGWEMVYSGEVFEIAGARLGNTSRPFHPTAAGQ
jgi:hypothetical protein